jgi:cobyric acid synthase CobQ/L-threonine-O-3-phosphate decarboxylase
MTSIPHGGNLKQLALEAGRNPGDILDFSANINPLGLPDWVRPVISRHISDLVHYPDPDATDLTRAAADRYHTRPDEILVGNGSAELINLLALTARTSRAVIPVPSYSDYARAARLAGMEVSWFPLTEADGFTLDPAALAPLLSAPATVFIGQPNNPTGRLCPAAALRDLAMAHPTSLFIVDEAFGDFVEAFDSLTINRPPNMVVLLSLTKIFAIPGLRLGCAAASADIVRKVRDNQPLWSVNTLAQAVGVAALQDAAYVTRSRGLVTQERGWLTTALSQITGLTLYPGSANFLLARLANSTLDAPTLAKRLLTGYGIAIRACDNFQGLDQQYFRIAVRTHDENEALAEALRQVLERAADQKSEPAVLTSPKTCSHRTRRTPAIMFQGTTSNAGKSVLTAALCRIMLQDGYRVAPFKSQNMSLNSFVTRSGGEMGRAQVVQAQACRLEPDVRMNPILLKPNSATGSQVIVLGKPVGNMSVGDYIRYKPEAFKTICQAYDELADGHDVIVLEGAGSPGEVNLKSHDIVNMNMARYAHAPVLLAGDIDRGGVFSAFVGTMEVLTEWERALVAGFVVNRFRGQESLLKDALDYMLRVTGRPVFGVVPNLPNLNLPEEDSVTFKSGVMDQQNQAGAAIEIAVIDLPHISNFTDFDAFRAEPDVHLRIVRSAGELGTPDAVILPGSKNTLHDLAYLKQSGLADRLMHLSASGKTEIVGICGGFQMIGREIEDPACVETTLGRASGLGLLDIRTVMLEEKTLMRVSAQHPLSGHTVHGYEIHHGQTKVFQPAPDAVRQTPYFLRDDGESIGAVNSAGNIWGTYLHGVFDADAFRRWFINRLRTRNGLPPLEGITSTYDIEPALDNLANVVRKSLRIDDIYRLIGLRS